MIKSEFKVIEANTPDNLTEQLNLQVKDGWKLLVGSYQAFADQGNKYYTVLLMKDTYEEDIVSDADSPYVRESALNNE